MTLATPGNINVTIAEEDVTRKIRDGLIKTTFYVCGACDAIDESYTLTDKCPSCGWEGELDEANTRENAEKIAAIHKQPGYNRIMGRLEAPIPVKEENRAVIAKSVSAAIEAGIPPITWRIHNLLTSNGIVIIASPPKQFKTFVAIHAAIAISNGDAFLDKFPTTKGRVLYVDEENGEANLIRRFKQLGDGHHTTIPDSVYYTSFAGLKLDGINDAMVLEELIDLYKPDVVFLDSMVRFMTGDEDKASDVRVVFENLKGLLKRFPNVSFFILHHTRKGNGTKTKSLDDLRGSSDFGAFADAILGVEATDKGFTFRVMANRHVGLMEVLPQEVEVQSDRQSGPITLVNHGVGQTRKVRAKVALVDWLRSENKVEFRSREAREYLESLGLNQKAFYEAIKELTSDGDIAEQRVGIYRLQTGSIAVEEDFSR